MDRRVGATIHFLLSLHTQYRMRASACFEFFLSMIKREIVCRVLDWIISRPLNPGYPLEAIPCYYYF